MTHTYVTARVHHAYRYLHRCPAAVAQREPRRVAGRRREEGPPLADAVAPPDPSDEEVPDDLPIFKHTVCDRHVNTYHATTKMLVHRLSGIRNAAEAAAPQRAPSSAATSRDR